jgi:hypothetical protein
MKTLSRVLALECCLALGLAGCAGPAGTSATSGATTSTGASPVSGLVSGINSVTAALSSPAANQAAANLKVGATAFVCAVGSVSGIATQLNTQLKAGSALIRDSTDVYVVSSTLCTALGGNVAGREPVSNTATASIPTS